MNEKGDGWIVFAAVVLGVAGIMRIFDALWAFRTHNTLSLSNYNLIFGDSLKTYGWVWLLTGALLILAAFGVMAQQQWSRWFGVFAGAIMAIGAIAWITIYPAWSLAYTTMGVLVIYALADYGGQTQDA
jgi:hypothetical protein